MVLTYISQTSISYQCSKSLTASQNRFQYQVKEQQNEMNKKTDYFIVNSAYKSSFLLQK